MKTSQINKEVLYSIYRGCAESMKEVFSEFLNGHAIIRQNLLSSYQSGSFDSLKRFLHFHGPSFMYLGMPYISESFKELEQQCLGVADQNLISDNFSNLIQLVDESKALVVNEMEHLLQAG
jgi:uncharacterized protein (DUF488 family)